MNYRLLYGDNVDENLINERIEGLKKWFYDGEKENAEFVFSSPGRAEILGNHTDHNNGLVIVASISCDILACVKKTNDNVVKIYSKAFEPVIVDITNLNVNKTEYSTSNALVRGIVKGVVDKGYTVKGFTAYTDSTIFKGAGVSSSASFEVLVCEIFNTLYLNGKLTEIDRAVISKYSENVYFNKPCGLLDQSGISIGSMVKLDFINAENPKITKLNEIKGYSLVITNTGGDHISLTNHYASIKNEMSLIANYFGKNFLREVSYNQFLNEIPNLKRHFTGKAILRAMHFFKENIRVEKAENYLKNNDIQGFLKMVNESGLSSLVLLQNCAIPLDEAQPIVLAIEYSRQIITDGAVRVHGGGFAGSILAIVNDSEVDNYILKMSNLFSKENVFKASIRQVGTTLLSSSKM